MSAPHAQLPVPDYLAPVFAQYPLEVIDAAILIALFCYPESIFIGPGHFLSQLYTETTESKRVLKRTL